MRKYLFSIYIITSNLIILNAQNRNSGTISGVITYCQMKKPVEFATIVAQQKDNDKVAGGTVTDSPG